MFLYLKNAVASISSSNQSHATIMSNRSYWSRRSSGWRSGILSVTASPLASRKASQQSRLQDNAMSLEIIRQAHLNVVRLSFPGKGTGEDAGEKMSYITYPVAALQKNAERKPRSASSPQEPFVISSGIPFNSPILPVRLEKEFSRVRDFCLSSKPSNISALCHVYCC